MTLQVTDLVFDKLHLPVHVQVDRDCQRPGLRPVQVFDYMMECRNVPTRLNEQSYWSWISIILRLCINMTSSVDMMSEKVDDLTTENLLTGFIQILENFGKSWNIK